MQQIKAEYLNLGQLLRVVEKNACDLLQVLSIVAAIGNIHNSKSLSQLAMISNSSSIMLRVQDNTAFDMFANAAVLIVKLLIWISSH